jgi:hypothetical protein
MIAHVLIAAAAIVTAGRGFHAWVNDHAAPRLVWSMTVKGHSIVIDYEFFNDTDDTIYLGDELWWGKPRHRDANLIGSSFNDAAHPITFSKATDWS